MKYVRPLLLALLAFVCAGSALADGGHHHHHRDRARIGVYIGAPLGPWFYPPPIYYPPRVIVVPPAPPPVYIEQYGPPPAVQYWYYCREAGAYYPQVGDCPGPWERVLPRP